MEKKKESLCCKEEKEMTGGFLGKLFDLDGDGKLNAMEQAMDFMLFDEMAREEESEESIKEEF